MNQSSGEWCTEETKSSAVNQKDLKLLLVFLKDVTLLKVLIIPKLK